MPLTFGAMLNTRSVPAFIFIVAAVVLMGCQQPGKSGGQSAHAVTPRTVIKYARGFRIDYYDGYREVGIVNSTAGKTDTLHFLLVDEGVAPPGDRPGIPVITTPVKQFAVQSSVQVALADFACVA